eukprot:1154524-Pelagomonas_calceolata.AAC.2
MPLTGATFDTPDAFSLRAKQLQLPDRESDNGWRSVLVDGVVLEDVRYSYLKGKRETAKSQWSISVSQDRKMPDCWVSTTPSWPPWRQEIELGQHSTQPYPHGSYGPGDLC